MNLLGIDVGTTSLKAVLYDEKGNEISFFSEDYSLICEGGFIEFPACEYVAICRRALEEIAKKHKIDAMAIDTQGETLILCDNDGNPLCNAVVWLDARATKEAAEISAVFGEQAIYEVTGQPEITASWPLTKILWFKKNRPEIWADVKKIFMLEDYLIYTLSGEFVCEKSLQSSTLYFNIKKGDWWDSMLEYAQINRDMLPKICESGEKVGKIGNIILCTGALDQIAGAVGTGAVKSGIISEMTGTTMAICVPCEEMPTYNPKSKIPCHVHVGGKYCMILWSPTAGMALKWFKNNFCENLSFKEIDELAKDIPEGCEGLVMLPYLCGSTMPIYNPNAQGVFFGITLAHKKGHFARAILEAVAFMLKSNLEYINTQYDEIRVTGGGAFSKLWCEIKSDVVEKKLYTLKNTQSATLGAAILAGVGVGEYKSVEEACERLVVTDKLYTPCGHDYSEYYQRFKKLDERLNNWEGGLWQ